MEEFLPLSVKTVKTSFIEESLLIFGSMFLGGGSFTFT